jgi:hypothetical protein
MLRALDELIEWSVNGPLRLLYEPNADRSRIALRFNSRASGRQVWSAWVARSSGADIWIGSQWLKNEAPDLAGSVSEELDAMAANPAGRAKDLLALPLGELREPSNVERIKELISLVAACEARDKV